MRIVTYLQISTLFSTAGRITCQLLNVHGFNDISWTEMHVAEPLLPESSSLEAKIATEK
jgi:hypothetical protein